MVQAGTTLFSLPKPGARPMILRRLVIWQNWRRLWLDRASAIQETLALGEAFLTAAAAWAEPFAARTGGRIAYPVAVGAVAGQTGVPLADALAGYLHAAASQMVSAGLRLGVCGQKQGVTLLAGLEGPILDLASKACGGASNTSLHAATAIRIKIKYATRFILCVLLKGVKVGILLKRNMKLNFCKSLSLTGF